MGGSMPDGDCAKVGDCSYHRLGDLSPVEDLRHVRGRNAHLPVLVPLDHHQPDLLPHLGPGPHQGGGVGAPHHDRVLVHAQQQQGGARLLWQGES